MSVIWMAKMRRRDKIGLYVLFGLGFFTVAVIMCVPFTPSNR